ncbi:MAG TPA: hypothetical protein VE422_25490 [Terriglobia bacterium]|nr:hypothetical protein [Terriglobia bacterium]
MAILGPENPDRLFGEGVIGLRQRVASRLKNIQLDPKPSIPCHYRNNVNREVLQMKAKCVAVLYLCFGLLPAGSSAFAQTSISDDFDIENPITLTGTLTSFFFAAPNEPDQRVFLYVSVSGTGPRPWAIEGYSRQSLAQHGLVIAPPLDGPVQTLRSGQLISIVAYRPRAISKNESACPVTDACQTARRGLFTAIK